jgi:hypothetical protein
MPTPWAAAVAQGREQAASAGVAKSDGNDTTGLDDLCAAGLAFFCALCLCACVLRVSGCVLREFCEIIMRRSRCRIRRDAAPRVADQSGDAYKAEPRVLGMLLGRELFDTLFPSVAILDASTCVVCMEPAERDEPCRQLRCGHGFHRECIDCWWLHTKDAKLSCPVCRRTQAPGTTDVDI